METCFNCQAYAVENDVCSKCGEKDSDEDKEIRLGAAMFIAGQEWVQSADFTHPITPENGPAQAFSNAFKKYKSEHNV